MLADSEILKAFKASYDKDENEFIKKWIVRWRYIDVMQNKQEFYQLERLYSFEGKKELTQWLDYCTWHKKGNYFPENEIAGLIALSGQKDESVFKALGLEFKWDVETYQQYIGNINAEDYMLQNFYPVPERSKINTVLDFGAGYGRQANLWSQKNDRLVYVGMDAIPNSYCTQHIYYAQLGVPFHDYVEEGEEFRIDNSKPGIYHLPTWRYDLLPSASFDLVICSQVLSEINGKLAKHMIRQFQRILKPGGALYVRDPGPYMHKCGNKVNIDQYILDHDMVLEFSPYIRNEHDLHSFPRIFRRMDPDIEASKRANTSIANELNYYTGGRLKKYYRKLTRK